LTWSRTCSAILGNKSMRTKIIFERFLAILVFIILSHAWVFEQGYIIYYLRNMCFFHLIFLQQSFTKIQMYHSHIGRMLGSSQPKHLTQ